jgi:hypothetical protein
MQRPTTTGYGGGGFGLGSGTPVPRDLVIVLATLFATFSLQFFESTAVIPAVLRLSTAVFSGFVWQIVTYPFIGWGGSGLWFLLELLILFWFGRDVFWRLGQRRFWLLLARAAVGAAMVALVVQLLQSLGGGASSAYGAFQLMQGQRILLAVVIAAFATLYGEATILLFFVLPLKARWFLWLEILFVFVFYFLPYKDLAGLVGTCVAVFLVYSSLTPGGPRWVLHRWRRRLEERVLRARLDRMRRKRRFDVIDGSRKDDETIH